MISTEERSPSGRDNSTARLTNSYNNNNNEENNLYYQYVPSPPAPSSPRTTSARAAPASHIGFPTPGPPSPILHNHHQLNNHHQEIVLRDPTIYHQPTSTAVALPNDSTTTTNGGIAEFIQNHLSSRIIPKLGSIVKRFSLNYSGEGLVTDRQRTRTVRVGIRFQVQVDSFVNNRLQQQEQRPRAILRTQSAPSVEQLDSGFSSPTADIIFPPTNSRQLALEYSKQNSLSNPSISTSTSEYCCGSSGSSASRGSNATSTNSIGFTDSSSGVSSEASSPVLNRRQYHHQIHYHPEEQSSSTLAFHNRINQALNLYRNQQLVTSSAGASTAGSPPADSYLNRRSSVQVYRRGSSTPPERSSSVPEQQNKMEDSSSYQVLRHFPGSNVNSLNELSWETAAFEKEIRDRLQWIGDKISGLRIPRMVSQLLDFGREYARENPVTALILLALCLTSSAPVLIFLVFAVATILVTFLGFLFVEGTLLTVATVIFGGVIVIVGFVTLTAVLLGMLGYFTTNQAYLVVTGQSRIYRLLRKLPVIGRFFPDPGSRESESYSFREEISSHHGSSNKGFANGKVPDGYHPGSRGHVDFDDDEDVVDILDSDVEDDDQDDMDADSNNVVLNGNVGSSDSEALVEEEDEDLGNQEVVSGEKAEKKNDASHHDDDIVINGTVEEDEAQHNNSSSTPTLVNGHNHHDDEEDEQEIRTKKQKDAESSESVA